MNTSVGRSRACYLNGGMRQPAVVALIVATILASTTTLMATEDDELIPKQITVGQFERYLDWLTPTRSQFVEAVSLYKAYLGEYAHLRATEIEPQLVKRVTETDLASIVKRYKDLEKENDRVRRKVTKLGLSLFDSLQNVVSDHQLADLERARRHRIRQSAPIRYFFDSTGRKFTDLTDVASGINGLEKNDRTSLEATMARYDPSLTRLVRQLTVTVPGIQGRILAGLLEQGLKVDSAELGAAHDELWTAMAERSLRLAVKVDKLNERTSRSIEASVSASGAAAWRAAYVEAVYPHAHFIVRSESYITAVNAQVGELSEDDRLILDPLSSEALEQLRITFGRLVAADDAKNNRLSSDSGEGGSPEKAYGEARSAARVRVSEVLRELREQLQVELSDPGIAAWRSTSALVLRSSHSSSQSQDVHSAPARTALASFVPISHADLRQYGELLDLNEEQVILIGPLVAAYLPQARAVVATAHKESESGIDKHDWLPSTRALRELSALDEGVFDSIGMIIVAGRSRIARLDSLRALRRRQLLAHKIAAAGAAEVDFAHVVYNSRLAPNDLMILDKLIEEYDGRAVIVMEALLRASRKILDLRESGAAKSELAQAKKTRQNLQVELATLNLELNGRSEELLPPESRNALQESFSNAAFGEVIHDRSVMQELIQKATEVPNLDEEQRESIADHQEEYYESYRKLNRAMVDTLGDTIWWWPDEHDELWPGGTDKRVSALRTLRFDRQQLNALARLVLRAVLSADQFERIDDRA